MASFGSNRRNITESSATYQMLVTMGFNTRKAATASRLYLNDIESAVNHCSSDSDSESASSEDYSCKFGSNFHKCANLLNNKYPQFLSLFTYWFQEEEFEDAQLSDEFAVNEAYDESFFIQYVEENCDEGINQRLLTQLYDDLVDAITTNQFESMQAKLIDAVIHMIQKVIDPIFGSIPPHIYAECFRFTRAPFENITLRPTYNQMMIEHSRRAYEEQCSFIFPHISNSHHTHLFALHAIGRDNNIPLLTFLMDSYNRYCIQNTKMLMRVMRTPSGLLHKLRKPFRKHRSLKGIDLFKYIMTEEYQRIDEAHFINQRCSFENEPFREICIESMEYLMNGRRMSKPSLYNTSIYRVNDSIVDYAFCIFECYKFISQYTTKCATQRKMPLQFDIWIVPQSVTENGEIIENNIGDIEDILKRNNMLYCKHDGINCETVSELMYDSASKLLKHKRNERCCMIIDRRNKYNNKLYAYQPTIAYDIESDPNTFVNEALFNNSIQSILPDFGVKDELNGYMFNLSFHCISKYEIRVYLYIDTFGMRFFLEDVTEYYLSQFFVSTQKKYVENLMKSTNLSTAAMQFKKKYNECRGLVNDLAFEQFYKLILKVNEPEHAPF